MLARQFQHRKKMYDHTRHAHLRIKQAHKFDKAIRYAQFAQDDAHMFTHRQLFAIDAVVRMQLGLLQDGADTAVGLRARVGF